MTIHLLRFCLGAAAALSIFAAPAFADVQGGTNNSSSQTIADNDPNGVSQIITIMDNEIIEDVSICIEGLNHTWMGDLVATITHLDTGTSATLFTRVGKGSLSGPGDSSNFLGNYVFADTTNNDLWDESGLGTTDYFIRNTGDGTQTSAGTYRASNTIGAPVSLAGIFGGESTAGDWEFNISDRNFTQAGSYDNVSLKFVSAAAIPEPGTIGLSLVACSVFGLVAYRRRKRDENSTTEDAAV